MNRALLFAIPLGFAASFAIAQEAEAPAVNDADGSGDYSLQELQATYPDLTEEGYAAVDTDSSGSVSADELKAAQDNGTLKAPAAE